MLADNRDVIADILEGLAGALPLDDEAADEFADRFLHGADTLRWSMELEATPTDGELVELERLREYLEATGEVLDRVKVEGRREHPAAKVTAIRAAYGALT